MWDPCTPTFWEWGRSGEALLASRGQHCSACCAPPGHPRGTYPFSLWKAGSTSPVQVTDSCQLSPVLLGWRKSGMLIFVPGSRRPGLCPTLPMAVKTFEKEKKQFKTLVERAGMSSEKANLAAEHWGSTKDFQQDFLGFFWQKSLAKKLRCFSSLCPVTPLVITEAMERPLKFLGKSKQSRQLSCQVFPLENRESSDPG